MKSQYSMGSPLNGFMVGCGNVSAINTLLLLLHYLLKGHILTIMRFHQALKRMMVGLTVILAV